MDSVEAGAGFAKGSVEVVAKGSVEVVAKGSVDFAEAVGVVDAVKNKETCINTC
jgi:hypothetical protein